MQLFEFQNNGMSLELEVSPAVPLVLIGDDAKIRQILINYLSNAVKYAGKGLVRVRVEVLSEDEGEAKLNFEVSDEGEGVQDANKASIFERFYRAPPARNLATRGTGLGLAVCRSYADIMGGEVGVKDHPEGGSIFFLQLTLEKGRLPGLEGMEAAAKNFAGKKSLVVEDMDYNLMVVEGLLREMQFEVTRATCGEEALGKLRQQEFDIIFTDWELPDISGVEITRLFRAEFPGSKTRIYATTAYASKECYEACMQAGMNGFICKPITKHKIREALLADHYWDSRENSGLGDQVDMGALEMLANHRGVPLRDCIKDYLSRLEDEMQTISQSIESGDGEIARKAAHRLLSHASILACEPWIEQIRELQSALRAGNRVQSIVCLEQLKQANDALAQTLNQKAEPFHSPA